MSWFRSLLLSAGSFALGFGTSQFGSAAASSRAVHDLTAAIAQQYEDEHRTEQAMIATDRQQVEQVGRRIAAGRSHR